MHMVSEGAMAELSAVMHAIQKDRGVWHGWHYVKIETLTNGAASLSLPVYVGIHRIFEIFLNGLEGTVFLGEHGEIHVFCKGASFATLESMSRQVLELVRENAQIAVRFDVYDIFSDYERILALGKYETLKHATNRPGRYAASAVNEITSFLGPKVLLVEDDPVTRWMVKMALKDQCRLEMVCDGNKALNTYKACQPDVVLLDINLPGKDGHAVTERILAVDPGAYVVMFSSHDSLTNIVTSIENGAKGFIAKPFNKDQLLQYVHRR